MSVLLSRKYLIVLNKHNYTQIMIPISQKAFKHPHRMDVMLLLTKSASMWLFSYGNDSKKGCQLRKTNFLDLEIAAQGFLGTEVLKM